MIFGSNRSWNCNKNWRFVKTIKKNKQFYPLTNPTPDVAIGSLLGAELLLLFSEEQQPAEVQNEALPPCFWLLSDSPRQSIIGPFYESFPVICPCPLLEVKILWCIWEASDGTWNWSVAVSYKSRKWFVHLPLYQRWNITFMLMLHYGRIEAVPLLRIRLRHVQ